MAGTRATDASSLIDGVRRSCLDLPGVEERLSHGTPASFVARRAFVQSWVVEAYRIVAPARLVAQL